MASAVEDYDLQAAWRRACESYAATTGAKLDDRQVPTPEQIIGSIKAEGKKEKKDNARLEAAKVVLQKSVTCIIRIGNVAAQAASMFFGPSSMCLNAVSFFVQAAADYGNIFKGLDELFSRISDALERFQVYLNKQSIIDVPMKRIANELLLRFVKICELSYKVLHRHRGLQFLKTIAFQDDAGVQAELNELARLVERESQMRGTLNYVSTKKTEKNVEIGFSQTLEGLSKTEVLAAQSLSSLRKLETTSELKKQKEDVDLLLGKPEDTFRAEFKDCIETAVPGTGDWLEDEVLFEQWANLDQNFDSLLFLSGDEGFGKTYLMSAAVKLLEKRHPQAREDATRVSVASYYFKRLEKENKGGLKGSNRDSQSIDTALRTLAWQIAQNDLIYRSDILKQYKNSRDLGETVEELWRKLFTSHHTSNATFFLLIDGIDYLEEKYERVLLELLRKFQTFPKAEFRLRLLFTGRADMLEKIKRELSVPVETVDVALKNGNAIAEYIRKKVENLQILKGSAAHVQKLREEVQLSLTANARGDFINIDLLLEEISKKKRPEEIRAVLENARAGKGRSDNLAREIDRCNQTFSIDDIQDLSMLLTWVISANRTLSIEELEEVLFIRKHDQSLRPLSDRIRDEFSIFFQIRGADDNPDAEVTLKADTITEHFKNISLSADNGVSPPSEEINETEVRVVRHFLKSMCDDELFQKFGFEDFFISKKNKSTSIVNPDLETAHARILLDCLRTTHGEFGDHANSIKSYAIWNFADHFIQVNLSLTDPKLKAEVGKRLLAMFKDGDTIEQWHDAAWSWIFDDVYVDTAMQWFKDSAVVKNIAENDKKWIDELTSNTRSSEDLLEHVARFKAKAWLKGGIEYEVGNMFQWIRFYLNKLKDRRNPEPVTRLIRDYSWDVVEDDEVYNAATEAQKLLGLDELDYSSMCRLAETMFCIGKFDLAIDEYGQAASLVENPWWAHYGCALAQAGLEQWEPAIQTMKSVINQLRDYEIPIENREAKLKTSLSNTAIWYRKLRKFDEARKIYDQMLKESVVDYSIYLDVMTLLDEQNKHAEVMEFLLQMKQQIDESTQQDKLTQMFLELADLCDYDDATLYHTAIVKAASKVDGLRTVKETYQNALDAAKLGAKAKDGGSGSAEFLVANLMYFLGIALYNHDTGDDEVSVAVRLWEQVLALNAVTVEDVQRRAVEKLAWIYRSQARAAGYASDIALSNLRKLQALFPPENPDDNNRRILLGRFYSLFNERDKVMDYLKPYVELGIALLSDDDPTNDWQGYYRLAFGFMFSGDDINALAAWSLMGPTTNRPTKQSLENGSDAVVCPSETKAGLKPGDTVSNKSVDNGHNTTLTKTHEASATDDKVADAAEPPTVFSPPPLKRSATSMLQRKPQGPLHNSCDGSCGTIWTYADDLYVCKDCFDVQFCGSCLGLLQKGDLTRYICDRKHEFLHVPKWDFGRAEEIGEGNISIGGQVMPVQEWLDTIRKDWGITTSTKADA